MATAKKTTTKRTAAKKTATRPPKPAPVPEPVAVEPAAVVERAPRFAVIGTGRSGTGHVAALLQASGVNCGHEEWFRPGDGRTSGLDGDASWLALPDIEAGAWKGPVAHIVRNPVAVVRSLVGIRFFHAELEDAPFPQFAREHCPEIVGLEPLEAAVEWWVRWNTRCAAVAGVKLRVEDLRRDWALGELGDGLGVSLDPAAAAKVATNTNSRDRARIPENRIWELLDGRAQRFGYPM